ncbi:helix-turn-helix transcriptional regulator [Streptomyces sp. NPDC046925]|uniref:helix-turn-helix transcriptional regulator n=1 Tax=Streptomyces sp. NPDC046925 TaxID=3155375 RepID=UPI0033F283ED
MAGHHIAHGADTLCDAGAAVYERALLDGRIPRHDADPAPCLIDHGLLHPDIDDVRWLRATAPAVALPRLLDGIEKTIAEERDHEARLARAFEPLAALGNHQAPHSDTSAITVLDGLPRITDAVSRAMADATEEMLTVRPGSDRTPALPPTSPAGQQSMLIRGCRLRSLCLPPTRHPLPAPAHYEQFNGDIEIRTLDDVGDHLVILDRTVAFIPAHRTDAVALELRNPAVVDFLVTTFERLWHLATPLHPAAAHRLPKDGVTPRQRAIATLLTDGLTDADIANRLGMNIRTARVHIAALAEALGSEGRAQLGYLIGQSGILEANAPDSGESGR